MLSGNRVGFGAVDPNYDDSMPTYGTGNDTPTSKQAPVNTTTASGGQYQGNSNYSQITNLLGGAQPDLPDLVDTIMQNQNVGFGNFMNYFNSPNPVNYNGTVIDLAHTSLGIGGIGAGIGQYSNALNEVLLSSLSFYANS